MEKHFDAVVVGELNVDIIMNGMEKFPEIGKEILCQKLDVTLGSSSAIFASNLSSLGARVAFIGKVGRDSFASVVCESLQAKKVNMDRIVESDTLRTGATIILNYNQDRAMITYPGAMEDLRLEDIDFNFVARARHLHFSSVFLQPGIRNDLITLFRKAKKLGLTTSLDPQWDPEEQWQIDLDGLLTFVDVFLPNLSEFMHLTRTNSLEDGIKSLKDNSYHWIVVKDGNRGAYLWDGHRLHHQPAFLNNSVVDCIGAGDSFNAGFIRRFIDRASSESCLEFGALTGAVSTTCAGGTGAFSSLDAFRELSLKYFNVSV